MARAGGVTRQGKSRSVLWWVSAAMAMCGVIMIVSLAFQGFSSQRLIEHPYWVDLLRDVSADHRARLEAGQGDSLPTTGVIRSWHVSGDDDPRVPAHLRNLPPGLYSTEDGWGAFTSSPAFSGLDSFHALIVALPQGRLISVVDIEAIEAQQNRDSLYSGLWVVVLFVFIVGVIAWLHANLVRPVRDLADRMRAIDPGQPGQRLPADYKREEVQIIAQASNAHLERVEQLIAREKSLLDQASHEFRTPIAVIAGAVDVLKQGGLPASTVPAFQRIEHAVADLSETMVALLYLAREPQAGDRVTDVTVLHELLPRLVADHEHLLHGTPARLRIAALEDTFVEAPDSMVRIAVGNLIRNAAENTAAGEVVVTLRDGVLSVVDSGSGFDPAEAARRYRDALRSASPVRGQGLGLYLIARMCERFGWRLAIEAAAEGGTRASLDLRAGLFHPSD